MGDASVLITLPMAMKKLRHRRRSAKERTFFGPEARQTLFIPKRRSRPEHELAESPHDAVRPRAVSENVHRPWFACVRCCTAWAGVRLAPRDVPKMKPMMTPTAASPS